MPTRSEKRAIKQAAEAHVKKMMRLADELKRLPLRHRIIISWYIVTRKNFGG